MKDGRVLSGIVTLRSDQVLTLQTLTEKVALPKTEIESVNDSSLSMMPDGLLEGLEDKQVLDLVRYLTSKSPPQASQ
jgi:putative heme-binding domain-containing protein